MKKIKESLTQLITNTSVVYFGLSLLESKEEKTFFEALRSPKVLIGTGIFAGLYGDINSSKYIYPL